MKRKRLCKMPEKKVDFIGWWNGLKLNIFLLNLRSCLFEIYCTTKTKM